jgi:hypothetical protein
MDATVLSLMCAMTSPSSSPERLAQDLLSQHLPKPCLGGSVVLVSTEPICCLDECACAGFRKMCSEVVRWTMIYDGPGAEAERGATG